MDNVNVDYTRVRAKSRADIKRIRQNCPPGTNQWINRLVENIDLVVEDLADTCNVDLEPDGDKSLHDKSLIFNALLITNHPQFLIAREKSKKRIGLKMPYTYLQENTPGEQLTEHKVVKPTKSFSRAITNELEGIFAGVGRNLLPETWAQAFYLWLVTNTLPLPQIPFSSFELLSTTSNSAQQISPIYPAIIIKKRIDKRELDQLITFIRESEEQIISQTTNLPDEPVKRNDADLTNLAVGLWAIKLGSQKKGGITEWINEKYKANPDYFGGKKNLTYLEVSKLKTEAKRFLNNLYPLIISANSP